jgi:hypothetical protein
MCTHHGRYKNVILESIISWHLFLSLLSVSTYISFPYNRYIEFLIIDLCHNFKIVT